MSEEFPLYGDSSDIGYSPDQIRRTLVHVLNEWAEATPTTTGIGAFARSNWISKSDRIGQGYTMFPRPAICAEMKRRQKVVRVCKEAASLMSPTVFDQPLQLPERLGAIGITIEIVCSNNGERVDLQRSPSRRREWRHHAGGFC